MLPDFRVRQRDYLLEITRAISQELNLDKLLTRILDISAEMLAGQAGLIALRSERGGWMVVASYGIPPAFIRYLDPLLAAVPDNEDPARFELPEINRLLQNLTRTASLGILTGVGLPMIVRRRVIGVVFIFRNYLGVFSANDRALLESFADQAAIAVQNAQYLRADVLVLAEFPRDLRAVHVSEIGAGVFQVVIVDLSVALLQRAVDGARALISLGAHVVEHEHVEAGQRRAIIARHAKRHVDRRDAESIDILNRMFG